MFIKFFVFLIINDIFVWFKKKKIYWFLRYSNWIILCIKLLLVKKNYLLIYIKKKMYIFIYIFVFFEIVFILYRNNFLNDK